MSRLFKIALPLLLVLGLVLAAGCAAKESPPMPPSAPMPSAPVEKGSQGVSYSATGGEGSATTTDRKIVRTGNLTLEVDNVIKAMDEVAKVAEGLGGYVVSSNRQGEEEKPTGRVSVRVPAERFNEAFAKLRALAIKVPYESTSSQDVTEQYTDLKAQLHNLEATEAQYLALLKKAETVKDTIEVQRELSNVRGEIERIKGRIQYLERTSDMALIEVNLQLTKSLSETGWSASETLKSAVRGLVVFGKVLADLIIWLLIFCPIWVPILVVVLFLRRRRKAKAG